MGTGASVYSAALCRGLIEAAAYSDAMGVVPAGIPRLYAAASLKQEGFEALLLRLGRIPRLYAAASLKLPLVRERRTSIGTVFRGSMPRPH